MKFLVAPILYPIALATILLGMAYGAPWLIATAVYVVDKGIKSAACYYYPNGRVCLGEN